MVTLAEHLLHTRFERLYVCVYLFIYKKHMCIYNPTTSEVSSIVILNNTHFTDGPERLSNFAPGSTFG